MNTKITDSGEEALCRAVRVFRTLAHPCRLQLLRVLAGGQVCDVATLMTLCCRPQPYISQQLGVLRKAGLVSGEAQGQRVCYRLISSQAEAILCAAGLLVEPSADIRGDREAAPSAMMSAGRTGEFTQPNDRKQSALC
jgi:ArsR family transcriptional regulator